MENTAQGIQAALMEWLGGESGEKEQSGGVILQTV